MKDDKRQEYLSWDGYFMSLAILASMRSKDPSTPNGACIIDPKTKSVLVMGYNGFPRGCSDDEFPWCREAESINDTKYPYVEHAERNAIYNAGRKGVSLENSHLYLYSEKGYFPCQDCAKGIIQSGIISVSMLFTESNVDSKWDSTPTIRMFNAANIKTRVLTGLEAYRYGQEPIYKDIDLMINNLIKIKNKVNNG